VHTKPRHKKSLFIRQPVDLSAKCGTPAPGDCQEEPSRSSVELMRWVSKHKRRSPNAAEVFASFMLRPRSGIASEDCYVQVWPPAPDFSFSSPRSFENTLQAVSLSQTTFKSFVAQSLPKVSPYPPSKSGSFASRTKESQAWKLKHRTLFRKYSFT